MSIAEKTRRANASRRAHHVHANDTSCPLCKKYGNTPNAETQKAMAATDVKKFTSIAALMADLNADD